MQRKPITAIVLAAGTSSRMGANKLLLPFGETTVLGRVTDVLQATSVNEIIVVTGHEHLRVAEAVGDRPVRIARNPHYRSGLATSIRQGIRAASACAHGYMICLGDMPLISERLVWQLCETFSAQTHAAIVAPVASGRRGHPVIFHRAYRDALLQLEGDAGARPVIQAHAEALMEVDVIDEGIFADVDTRETYLAALSDAAVATPRND